MKKIFSFILLFPIYFYQRCISPYTPAACRFTPTCSQYAVEAIKKHGPVKGLILALWRIIRCNPWGGCGYDPVPPVLKLCFDSHTHNNPSKKSGQIYSLGYEQAVPQSYFSVGIHPWHISEQNLDSQIEFVKTQLSNPRCRAIGESGLDSLCSTDIGLQLKAFKEMISLSENSHLPLIIHCVRAYQQLREIRMTYKPRQTWIIHGFRGKPELARELIKEGYYISLGEKFNPQTAAVIPLDRILLETDESKQSIGRIYRSAAIAMNVTVDTLQVAVRENAKHIYGSVFE